MIDLLTAEGRQAIIDHFDRNLQTTKDLRTRLETLIEQAEKDVHSVDWESDVAPVSQAAMDHLTETGRYGGTVQGRLLDLDLDLEEAGGIGDLDAEFGRITQARSAAEGDETALFLLTGRIGDRFRAALVRQVFTPPSKAS